MGLMTETVIFGSSSRFSYISKSSSLDADLTLQPTILIAHLVSLTDTPFLSPFVQQQEDPIQQFVSTMIEFCV